jgi:hypothetical protein
MTKLDEALGLFPSVIKSGEQWSPTCQSVLDEAKAELVALRARPEYLFGCRDPDSCQRHGECMYLGCPHAGKVVRPRMCVEPREDGIVYPKER